MLLVLSLSLAVLSTCVATSSDARHIDWPTWASHVSLNHGNCSHVLNSPLRFQLYLATMAAVEAQNQRSTRGESSRDAAIIPTAMLIPGDRNGFDACEPDSEWMKTQLRRLLGYATPFFPPLHRTVSIHFGMQWEAHVTLSASSFPFRASQRNAGRQRPHPFSVHEAEDEANVFFVRCGGGGRHVRAPGGVQQHLPLHLQGFEPGTGLHPTACRYERVCGPGGGLSGALPRLRSHVPPTGSRHV